MKNPMLPVVAFLRLWTPFSSLKTTLLIVGLTAITSALWATPEPIYSNILSSGNVQKNRTLQVIEPVFMSSLLQSEVLKVNSVNNAIILEMDEKAAAAVGKKFTLTLKLEIKCIDVNRRAMRTAMTPTMVLTWDSSAVGKASLRQVLQFKNAHQIDVKIMEATYVVQNMPPTSIVPAFFSLQATIAIDRVKRFVCNNRDSVVSHAVRSVLPTNSAKQDRTTVSWWVYKNADEYDLEWTFYDIKSEIGQLIATNSTTLHKDLDFLFTNNASRITTKTLAHDITMVYPQGYLFYRVRAAYYALNGQRQVTPWTSSSPKIAFNSQPPLSGVTLASFCHKVYIGGHDANWNWQTQQVFAEEGKQTQSLKYFDASLRERQTQALSNAANTVVMGETIYDYQGRPTLKVMPAPMANPSLGYTSGLSKNATNADYSRKDYIVETNDCTDAIPAMSPPLSKGAANYFSESNTTGNKHTPNAEGYPFSVTEFTPDATGRIRRQSGVGANFKLGSQHETQYFYAKPAQEELDRMFGIDAGDASTYLKNMVIDGNGQASISYIDAHGRTIATALAGGSTDNLNGLPSLLSLPNVPETLTKDLLNNVIIDNSLVSSYSLPVHTEGVHTIEYLIDTTKLRFEDVCRNNKNVCLTCAYDIDISITSDDCTFAPFSYKRAGVNLKDSCVAVSNSVAQQILTWNNNSLNLKRGTYQITKKLTVSQVAAAKNWEKYKQDTLCVPNREAFVKKAVDTLSFYQCRDSVIDECAACRVNQDYATFRADYIRRYPPTTDRDPKGGYIAAYENQLQQAYKDFIRRCRLNCSDECSILFQNLLSDVSPNGQYGVNYDFATKIYALKAASVYANTSTGIYLDENGKPDTLIINGVAKTPNQLTLNEFVERWKDAWAFSLVEKHPEFCYFTWCSSNAALFTFEDTLRQQTNYKIYTDLPTGTLKNLPLSTDPLSTMTGLTAAKRQQLNLVKPYGSSTAVSIFDIAKYTAYDCNQTVPTCTVLPIGNPVTDASNSLVAAAAIPSKPCPCEATVGKTGCAAQDSLFWETLRTLYLANRRTLIYELRDAELTATCKTEVAKIGVSAPYVDKVRRVFLQGDIDKLAPTAPYDSASQAQKAQALINAEYAENCMGLADAWLSKFNKFKCLDTTPARQTIIRNLFIEICKKGSDADHLNGATSIPATATSVAYTYKLLGRTYTLYFRSVEDIIKFFSPSYNECSDCSAALIESPGLYDAQYLTATVINNLSGVQRDTICNRLARLKSQFPRDTAGTGIKTFFDYFNSLSMVRMTQAEFDKLTAICQSSVNDKCIGILGGTMTIPPQLDNKCKSCADLNTLVSQYSSKCPFTSDNPISVSASAKAAVPLPISNLTAEIATAELDRLIKWLNYKTGLNLDANEYYLFFNQCRKQNSSQFAIIAKHLALVNGNYNAQWQIEAAQKPTLLCPRPQHTSEEIIDSSCYYAIKQQAINNANLRYESLVDSLKRDFLRRYTVICLKKAQDSEIFTDKGPSKEYHFTLYYYDQAGNLVQTVPPAGVQFLTAAELLAVKNYRKTAGSLVAHYPFNKDLKDYSNSNLNLTATANAPGVVAGEGLKLEGYAAYTSAITDILNNDQHTISFYAKFPTNNTEGWRKIFGYNAGGSDRSPGIWMYPSSVPKLHWRYDPNNSAVAETAVYNTNEWVQVTGVKNNGVFSYYVNGVKITEGNVEPVKTAGSAALTFGTYYSSNIALYLKDFRIYNTPLTTEEVTALNTRLKPDHALKTQYWYNSLNQVTLQKSPDAGTSCFWYDYLGRLILSQNAKQLDDNLMSYTLFDKLGRTVEVGESYWTWDGIASVPFTSYGNYSNIEQYYNAVDNHAKTLKKPQDFIYQYNNFGLEERWDVTRTFYDKKPINAPVIPNFTPENLRNRVAVTASYGNTYHDYADPMNDGYDNGYIQIATSYNYDVAGNVKTMVHDIPELQSFQYQNTGQSRNHRFKRLDYDYDLVSGKVNQLFYQRDEADQFIYRYVYDKDNRLTEALTSTNGVTWDREAEYIYYKHGPLSRIVLGRANNRIQGMDYAYTLQGWIKGVNASFLDPNKDIGKDGIAGTNAAVRKDAFGYTISYFDGDYKPIGGTNSQFVVQGTGTAPITSAYASKGLFNGNIRSIASQTEKLGNPILMTYDYDQLNRLNKMESWGGLTATTTTWNRATGPLSNWRENVVYDPNGNILTYKRNDETGTLIDDLTYNYNRDINQRLTNNRLASVGDAIGTTPNYGDDLEGTAAENAFQYDKIGNLTYSAKDTTSYYWNVYGKLGGAYANNYTSTSTGSSQKYRGSYFNYDVQQNRYRKTSYDGTSSSVSQTNFYKYSNKYDYDTDFYIRDAQGNVLAIYNQKQGRDYTYTQTYDPVTKKWTYNNVDNIPYYNTFALKEQHLYGSSRLGTLSLDRPMANNVNIDPSDTTTQMTGAKQYELTNHLGNVLATITDKGVITSAQDYYPFGLTLASRSFTAGSSYRYSFNGKEDDKGLKQQDYGMRIYRKDLGRFLSFDPIAKQYPELSPYQFASNMPINSIDLDGLEAQEIYDAFKWAANKTKNLVVETVVGTAKFGAYAGAMHTLGPVGDMIVAKKVVEGVAHGVKPIKTMAVGYVKILYGTATSTKIDVDQKEFNEAAHSTAKGIVKTAALSVLGEGVGMLAQEARIATIARQAKNGAAESGAIERAVAEIPKCFVAGTLVATINGFIPIEQIAVGDSVLTYSEKAKVTVYHKVAKIFANKTDRLTKLIVGVDTILCTPGHRFFTNKGWLGAEGLKSNISIKLASSKWKKVKSIFTFDTLANIYNLEIDTNHNYFITRAKLLVHNGECGLASHEIGWKGFRDGDALKRHYKDHVLEAPEAFGDITKGQYNTKAQKFAKEKGEHIMEKRVGDDYIVKYNPETGETFVGNSKRKEILSYRINDGRTSTPFEDAVKSAENMWANRQKK